MHKFGVGFALGMIDLEVRSTLTKEVWLGHILEFRVVIIWIMELLLGCFVLAGITYRAKTAQMVAAGGTRNGYLHQGKGFWNDGWSVEMYITLRQTVHL